MPSSECSACVITHDAATLHRELSGARTELDHQRVAPEPDTFQQRNLGGCVRVLLGVLALDVPGVEVLPTGAARLVDMPAWRCASHG